MQNKAGLEKAIARKAAELAALEAKAKDAELAEQGRRAEKVMIKLHLPGPMMKALNNAVEDVEDKRVLSGRIAAAIPKIPAGMARAWFYREDMPYDGLDRPYIRMNGAVVGISELGGAFYRDVSPGEYYVTVELYRNFVNQFPHVDLMLGETAYFQVFEVGSLSSGVGASRDYARPSFYIWEMPPAVAGAAVARRPFYAGGG